MAAYSECEARPCREACAPVDLPRRPAGVEVFRKPHGVGELCRAAAGLVTKPPEPSHRPRSDRSRAAPRKIGPAAV